VFEEVYAFNLLRPSEAKSFDDAKYVIVRKMVAKNDLKQMVNDEESLKAIESVGSNEYKVFDVDDGSYKTTSDETLVREFYFRPSAEYPRGYFYFTLDNAQILFQGELPQGVFPIIDVGFDEVPSSCRSHSIIRTCRSYQKEINRCSSAISNAQLILGDDKILYQSSTNLQYGGTIAGVRGIKYSSGQPPTILSGRSGDQYLNFLNSQISELYNVTNVKEDPAINAQLDPYALLFSSFKNREGFVEYGEKFERFMVRICETSLRLFKAYVHDDMLIPAIGKNEYINISEFRSTEDLNYVIKVEPRTDDAESMLGRMLSINHILQYVGQNLDKEELGVLIKNLPTLNKSELFSSLTIDYDNAVNDILALDRGEFPAINRYDNHKFLIKRLIHRTKKKDFNLLPEPVRQNYFQKITQHEQIEAEQLQEIEQLKAGFIPSGGYLVPVDFYASDPANPAKTKRVRLPYEAISWLVKRLEKQGMSQQTMDQMNHNMLSDMAAMMAQRIPQEQQGQPEQPQLQPPIPEQEQPMESGSIYNHLK